MAHSTSKHKVTIRKVPIPPWGSLHSRAEIQKPSRQTRRGCTEAWPADSGNMMKKGLEQEATVKRQRSEDALAQCLTPFSRVVHVVS